MTSKSWLDQLSPPLQFSLLASGVFLFFGVHNFLQEAMMNIPGFQFGVMLGYLEVLGVTICSFVERTYLAKERGRVAPMSAYPLLTACLMASSSLSNLALNYINFPTKVVFRSCKLIPTMIVASIVNRKVFTSVEYLLALSVSVGLILFAAADWELTPSFHPIGLAFVSLSVCADAILPNAQERLFSMGASRLEVTLFTNIFTLVAMTITTTMSGDLFGLIAFAQHNQLLCIYMTIYTFVAYIAISVHMTVVRRYGGVTAVLVATGRKGMTLVLSFLFFPKQFSWMYVWGGVLVLGGLLLSSLWKIRQKEQQKASQANTTNGGASNNTKTITSTIHINGTSTTSPRQGDSVQMVNTSSSRDSNNDDSNPHHDDESHDVDMENGHDSISKLWKRRDHRFHQS